MQSEEAGSGDLQLVPLRWLSLGGGVMQVSSSWPGRARPGAPCNPSYLVLQPSLSEPGRLLGNAMCLCGQLSKQDLVLEEMLRGWGVLVLLTA